MVVREDEQLFLDLMLFDGLTDERIKELKAEGFIEEDCENTAKAEKFIDDFVHARQEAIIDTLEEQVSYFKDKGHVLFHSGLKSTIAMEACLEHLAGHDVIKKKRNGDFIKRNGHNH